MGFFGMNNYTKPGPGVRKDEPEKTGLARYFDILGKRFWRMISLNFLYALFSIIPLVLMCAVCAVSMTVTVGFKMTPEEVRDWLNNGGTLMIGVMALLIYCSSGGGAAACGLINVLRRYVDDTHAWVWQDFIDGFKSNFLRGTIAYIIDCFSVGVLIINFGFYSVQGGALSVILQGLLVLVAFIWSMMHIYIYPAMTSFDLRLRDIYKNSFIMVIGKLPQTAAAFFLGLIISFIVIYFSIAFLYLALLIPIILFAFFEYTRLTISYPLIKKYMAAPPQPSEDDGGNDEEPVFSDSRVETK